MGLMMALYKYWALSEEGKKIQGIIPADSMAHAKESLRSSALLITQIILWQEKRNCVKLAPTVLLDCTRMIGQLLQASIPLYESIGIIEEKYRGHRFHSLFVDLYNELKIGVPLSEALAQYPGSFDPIYIAMVKSGEETGALSIVFAELCQLLEKQQTLHRQLLSATAYPLFLGGFCLLVFIALLVLVIPSMKTLFDGKSLHSITKFVFSLSDLVIDGGMWIGGGFASLVAALIYAFRSPSLRSQLDRLLLHIPMLHRFIKEAATVRFCRTAALLLSGGTPILETLELAGSVMKNQVLEQIILDARQRVAEGGTLSVELRRSSLIPSLVPRMLSIAEETGKTSLMLQSIADICEVNLEKQLQQAVSFLQPALLLLLGLIVGIVLLSILIPLTDVGSIL